MIYVMTLIPNASNYVMTLIPNVSKKKPTGFNVGFLKRYVNNCAAAAVFQQENIKNGDIMGVCMLQFSFALRNRFPSWLFLP